MTSIQRYIFQVWLNDQAGDILNLQGTDYQIDSNNTLTLYDRTVVSLTPDPYKVFSAVAAPADRGWKNIQTAQPVP